MNGLSLPQTVEVTDMHKTPDQDLIAGFPARACIDYREMLKDVTSQMQFHLTTLRDAWLIRLEPIHDSRGFFARTFCVDEFAAHGLETHFPQHSLSCSARKGTLRGMHYQRPPHCEVKLVRCVRGAIWDVIIDVRPDSPTYRRWEGFELSESNGCQLYIPKGFAHGFQALSEGVEV